MSFKLIFESLDFIIINKLQPCSYHSDIEIGFFEKVKAQHPTIISVHRLDRPTVGLCLFAKNQETAKIFGQLFEQKAIEKIYLALSDKKPIKKQGLIIGDMEKSRNGSYRLSKKILNPAITQFFSHSISPGKRLFVLKPHTGKTHQLRVMMKSISAPIIGDERYKGTRDVSMFLQSHQIKFKLNEKIFCFTLDDFLGIESELFSEKNLAEINWPVLKKTL